MASLPHWDTRNAQRGGELGEVLGQQVLCTQITVTNPPNLYWFWELEQVGLEGETMTPSERKAQQFVV